MNPRRKTLACLVAFAMAGLSGAMMACGDDDDSRPVRLDAGLDGSKDGAAAGDGAPPTSDAGREDAGDAGRPPDASVVAPPTFVPPAGEYDGPRCIELAAPNGTIHYTRDGSEPTTASPTFSGLIPVDPSAWMLRAIVVTDAGVSPVTSARYTIVDCACNTKPVTYSPTSGALDGGGQVSLHSASVGAVVCYAVDDGVPACSRTTSCGETPGRPLPPTCTKGLLYDGGALSLSGDAGATRTVRAVACDGISAPSDPTEASYTF